MIYLAEVLVVLFICIVLSFIFKKLCKRSKTTKVDRDFSDKDDDEEVGFQRDGVSFFSQYENQQNNSVYNNYSQQYDLRQRSASNPYNQDIINNNKNMHTNVNHFYSPYLTHQLSLPASQQHQSFSASPSLPPLPTASAPILIAQSHVMTSQLPRPGGSSSSSFHVGSIANTQQSSLQRVTTRVNDQPCSPLHPLVPKNCQSPHALPSTASTPTANANNHYAPNKQKARQKLSTLHENFSQASIASSTVANNSGNNNQVSGMPYLSESDNSSSSSYMITMPSLLSSSGLKGSTPLVNLKFYTFYYSDTPPPAAAVSKENVAGHSNENSNNIVSIATTIPTVPESKEEIVGSKSDQRQQLQSSLHTISLTEVSLECLVGGGGFGQVWRGSWRGTPVAVKILSAVSQVCQQPDFLSSSQKSLIDSFQEEVFMLSQLRHPNICLFMGASFDPPQRAIITEYVARGSLWDALRTDQSILFPTSSSSSSSSSSNHINNSINMSSNNNNNNTLHWPNWAIQKVLEGTCMGLIYLHSHSPPIIHRDLKSPNLLLTESFQIKICDFGLARLRNLSQTMTANVGTAHWMAPEVITGGTYNESADIYSLGLIVWELCTGQCPFEGLNSSQIAVAVALKGMRPPLPVNLTPTQSELITRCWSAEVSNRPTAQQFLTTLSTTNCFSTAS